MAAMPPQELGMGNWQGSWAVGACPLPTDTGVLTGHPQTRCSAVIVEKGNPEFWGQKNQTQLKGAPLSPTPSLPASH